MIRDTKHTCCEQCYHYDRSVWLGQSWEVCNRWGFRLHPEQGISEEECDSFVTEKQWRSRQQLEEMSRKRKRK